MSPVLLPPSVSMHVTGAIKTVSCCRVITQIPTTWNYLNHSTVDPGLKWKHNQSIHHPTSVVRFRHAKRPFQLRAVLQKKCKTLWHEHFREAAATYLRTTYDNYVGNEESTYPLPDSVHSRRPIRSESKNNIEIFLECASSTLCWAPSCRAAAASSPCREAAPTTEAASWRSSENRHIGSKRVIKPHNRRLGIAAIRPGQD